METTVTWEIIVKDRSRETKAALRAEYAVRRRSRTASERARAEEGLLAHARRCDAATIAAFVPVRGEPGGIAVLDALARTARVLLPLTVQAGTVLEWAVYAGPETLVAGPLGLRQPADDSVRGRLADADVVLVPAVAIGLDGSRLGHGAGYYDRALEGWPADRLVGVVHDDEVALALPAAPHDVRLGWLCTPTRLQRLGE